MSADCGRLCGPNLCRSCQGEADREMSEHFPPTMYNRISIGFSANIDCPRWGR
jgi:hypothetical protein